MTTHRMDLAAKADRANRLAESAEIEADRLMAEALAAKHLADKLSHEAWAAADAYSDYEGEPL